jgi:phage/plasmid-associated DNA primase/predicted transcriptional regulator
MEQKAKNTKTAKKDLPLDTYALEKKNFNSGSKKATNINSIAINEIKVVDNENNNFIETREVFNINIANHILEHIERFKPYMRSKFFEEGRDPILFLRKYVQNANIENGVAFENVTYKQNNGKGRYYAIGSLSLQSLCREIRHTISKEFYKDIDIVNCHPVLLQWLCEQNGFECKCLSKYVSNRDKYIKDDPKKKTLFLIMTNEGEKINDESLTEFEAKYWKEMKYLHKLFSQLKPNEFETHKKKRIQVDKKNYNHQASYMNTLLCDLENNILMHMWKFYDNAKDAVLCFDGIMLRIRSDDNYELKECQDYIEEKIGIKIILKIKDMIEGFDLTNQTIDVYKPMAKEKEEKYREIIQMIKDSINNHEVGEQTISLLFVKMMKEDIIVTNKDTGDGYQWNPLQKLWISKDKNELMNELCQEDNLILKAARSVEQEYDFFVKKNKNDKIKESIGLNNLKIVRSIKKALISMREVQNIYKFSQIKLINSDFKSKILNRNHDLLPILNGKIINLRTSEIRDRLKNDNFSFECPVNYIPEAEWTTNDKQDHKTFIEQIFVEDPEYIKYVQIKLGTYLCGDNCRDIDINHGYGRNGKSCLLKAISVILGNFFGYIGKDVVVFDPRQHRKKGGGNHTSHLFPIDGKRVVATQEFVEGDTLDGEIVKKIASADVIEGVRECYGRKTGEISPFCKLIVNSNIIPKFEVTDPAMVERLNFNPFKARFLNEEGIKTEKLNGTYNDIKYKYYPCDNELVKKYTNAGRNIDILFSWMVHGCLEFYAKYNDGCGIPKPQIVTDYSQNKIAENNVVLVWLNSQCEIKNIDEWNQMDKHEKNQFQIPRAELYEEFSNWAQKHEVHAGYGKTKFNDVIEKKIILKKTNTGFIYERIRLIKNIPVQEIHSPSKLKKLF